MYEKKQYIDVYKGFIHVIHIHYTHILININNKKILNINKINKDIETPYMYVNIKRNNIILHDNIPIKIHNQNLNCFFPLKKKKQKIST